MYNSGNSTHTLRLLVLLAPVAATNPGCRCDLVLDESLCVPTAELCNGLDDDCDGSTDEDVTNEYGRDLDGDGFYHPRETRALCSAPGADWVLVEESLPDCDDDNPAIYPRDLGELCNGLDDNCDGSTDEGLTNTYGLDHDGDLYYDPREIQVSCDPPGPDWVLVESSEGDCNDDDPHIFPQDGPETGHECLLYLDHDCDGEPNDGCCADESLVASACGTGLQCAIGVCIADTCVPTPLAGATCSDGDACTVGDYCDGIQCHPGPNPLDCTPNTPCLVWSCDASEGCVSQAVVNPCDDGDPCTDADACENGECRGVPRDCGDGNECTIDACDAGTCQNVPTPGTSCNDGNGCTSDDECDENGACLGEGGCDDDNLCTVDDCLENKCVNKPVDGLPCEDGDLCTLDDICLGGACQSGSPMPCPDDNNLCTTDGCEDGECVYDANSLPCDDGDPCTHDDKCSDKKCKPDPNKTDCDDDNSCTKDSCMPEGGCAHDPLNGAPCDDNDPCTTGDSCVGDTCEPGFETDCDDHNSCTKDDCTPEGGCTHEPQNGAPCDDNDPCTTDDSCVGDTCESGSPNDCDDGNPCTVDDCTPEAGCAHKPKNCDDKNPCTNDVCDEEDGTCVHQPNTDACDDLDPCTMNEHCFVGQCQPGEPKICDDGNDCTDDSCDAGTGDCIFTHNSTGCDDDLEPCTWDYESCTDGACSTPLLGQMEYSKLSPARIHGVIAREGGLVLIGQRDEKLWLATSNPAGVLQNEQMWGAETYPFFPFGSLEAVVKFSDGGFATAGYVAMTDEESDRDAIVVWTDSAGNQQYVVKEGGYDDDEFHALVALPDGGLVVAGFTIPSGENASHAWLYGHDGESETMNMTSDAENSRYYAIAATDSGYVLAGNKGGGLWLTEVYASGDTKWEQTYSEEGDGVLYDLVVLDDGFALAGRLSITTSDHRLLFMRTDAGGGVVSFEHSGANSKNSGRALGVLPGPESGFVVAGHSEAHWTQGTDLDIWVVGKDIDGATVWSQKFLVPGWDEARALAVLPGGAVVVGGFVDSDVPKLLVLDSNDEGNPCPSP